MTASKLRSGQLSRQEKFRSRKQEKEKARGRECRLDSPDFDVRRFEKNTGKEDSIKREGKEVDTRTENLKL